MFRLQMCMPSCNTNIEIVTEGEGVICQLSNFDNV